MPEEIAPYWQNTVSMPDLKRPVFPELTVNISDKGAKADEPITLIVNQTIMDVHNRGGGLSSSPKGNGNQGVLC